MYKCAFSLVPVISYCCIDDRYCAAEGVTSETMRSGGLRETGEPHYVLATGFNLTTAQKAEVDALVKKIRPVIPFYITAIDKKSLSGPLVHVVFLQQIQ